MNRLAPLCLATALLGAVGCGDSFRMQSGATEPIRVQNGQFFSGELPVGTSGPALVTVESQNNLLRAGEVGKKLSGRTAKGGFSVALRFEDIGTGYWVVPVGAPDPQTDGELTWEAICDVARDAAPGNRKLVFSAADGEGRPGPKKDQDVIVQGTIPDGFVVISLTWDTNADLDLHVVAPNGKELDPKHVTTALGVDAGADADAGLPPGTGVLDRDSNGACAIDNYRQENVVFSDRPVSGKYVLRVDMFDACNEAAANYQLAVYAKGAVQRVVSGRLIDLDADGGGPGSGLFVLEITL